MNTACAAIFWLMSLRHNSSGGERLRRLCAEGKGGFFLNPSVRGFYTAFCNILSHSLKAVAFNTEKGILASDVC